MINPWMTYVNAMRTSAEALQVIGLRMLLMGSGGPRAGLEAQRMFSEKVLAFWKAQAAAGAAMASGPFAMGARALAPYQSAVRANHRRLRRRR